jgi:two-component system, NarL family, sensor kinase
LERSIQEHQTKSICCLPLLNQAKLVGVLYLENQLAVKAFTPERTQVLNLLSTQAAIAIENARLYTKVRANESKIAQFLEAIPVGIGIMDAVGRPYYFNQQAIQLLGKGIDPSVTLDRISEDYQIYLAGTDRKYPTEKLPVMRALSGERTRIDDSEIRRNNATIPVEAWGTPIFDEQGSVTYSITAFQDITERKQAEKLLADYNRTLEQQVAERTAALQKSETKFRNIFENSQVGIFRTRLSDGLILDANQRFADLFGFDSPDEMIGNKQTTDCYVNSSDRQQAVELLKWDDELQNFEVQLRKRDGTLFWGLYSCRLNAVDGYLEGVIADISEQQAALRDRKSAEAALRDVYDELRLREQELRTLADALPALVGYVNANRRFQFANQTYEDWFRCSRDEILGKSVREVLGETAYQIAKPYIDRAQAGQNTTYEAEILFPAGKKYVSVIYIPDADSDARVKGYYVLVTDMSEQRNAALRERKRAEEASILEERNRMAREIHDTLAQAFTGILIQIGAATQVLTDDPEATQAHLDTIEDLARTGLTEARRSVTALRPQLLEEGNLSTALDRLVTQMRAATDTAVIYETQGKAYPLPDEVENNFLRIGQEALTNAIKYACASKIRMELIYDDAQCCLRVKDDEALHPLAPHRWAALAC